MTSPRAAVVSALKDALRYLTRHPEIVYGFTYKTYDYYGGRLDAYARELYSGKIDEGGYIDKMTAIIETQLTRAWNEGMRDNKLDPSTDMTPEFQQVLDDAINSEYDHVLDIAQAILDQRDAGGKLEDGIYQRLDMWQQRYTDVANQARIVTANKEDMYEWVYGDTDHCDTCMTLNGQVASMADWEDSGYMPQSPPNDALTCGGWRCQCQLLPTKKEATGAIHG